MKPKQGKVQSRRSEEPNSGTASAVAVHELNNLLTLVLGYSQLIIESTKQAHPNRHHAEQILKAGERAAAVTRQMAETLGRAGIRLTPLGAAAGHKTSEEISKPAESPDPAPSRRTARRG
jgi:signal transduction histidine kinase